MVFCKSINLSNSEINNILKHPSKKANDYGKSVPYHLQYIRKQQENNNKKD